MTVSSTTNREQYATDGVTTAFTIHFPFFNDTDVNAIFVTVAGGSTTLALNTDFSATGGDGAGGTLTTAGALSPLAAGGTLTIFREIPFTQEDDYVEDDPLPADTLEGGFDRAAMRDQQLKDAQDRALTFPVTIDPGVSAELPSPSGDTYLGWNSAGDALENKTLPAGTTVYSSIANTRAGTSEAEAVTPDGLASLWQEGSALVSAASIASPSDANLGGFYTQSGNTGTNTYWAGVIGGEEMEIRYTGTPTLGTSGNIIPPNAAAYAVTAGTIIRWRWDASVSKWRFVGGTKADGSALSVTHYAFSAHKNGTNQTGVVSATFTKVTFGTEEYDVGAAFASSTFTAPIAGVYHFDAAVNFNTNVVDQNLYEVALYKNGVIYKQGDIIRASGTGDVSAQTSADVSLAATDTIEVYARGGGAGDKTLDGATYKTWLNGRYVGPNT